MNYLVSISWLEYPLCILFYIDFFIFLFYFFSVRLLSVLRDHSAFFIPATTANDLRLRRIIYPRFYPLHLISCLNSWERASISLFSVQCLTRELPGTIFITSLVWHGPLNPGPRALEASTLPLYRLSRRRFCFMECVVLPSVHTLTEKSFVKRYDYIY